MMLCGGRLRGGRQLSTAVVKNSESIVPRIKVPSGVKTGNGGRHSNSGQKVAIFGAAGFLGSYVTHHLGKTGTNIVIGHRGDDMSWRHLKPMGDYGKIVPSYIHLKDEDSIRKTIAGADVVINCMGKHYETKHYLPWLINCSFEDVHVKGAELVARIAREEEVKHLVHVSCAYADHKSSSRFAQTKAVGEDKVNEQFPGAVIVRPNVMYGELDRFLSRYGMLVKRTKQVPLVQGGTGKLSPVFVGNVGEAIATIATNYSTAGQRFNLSGDHEYTQREVLEYVMEQIYVDKGFVDLPLPVAEAIGKAVNNLPNPYITDDQVRLMTEDAKTADPIDKTFADLGMDKIASFEVKAYNFLYFLREGGHFVDLREGGR